MQINRSRLADRPGFDVSAKVMGFPDLYGRNMTAWIDGMTDLELDHSM